MLWYQMQRTVDMIVQHRQEFSVSQRLQASETELEANSRGRGGRVEIRIARTVASPALGQAYREPCTDGGRSREPRDSMALWWYADRG